MANRQFNNLRLNLKMLNFPRKGPLYKFIVSGNLLRNELRGKSRTKSYLRLKNYWHSKIETY